MSENSIDKMELSQIFQKSKECFLDAFERLKNIQTLEGITMHMKEWNDISYEGFPNKIALEYTIDTISKTYLELQTDNDYSTFEKLEVVSIDTETRYRKRGYARKLLQQAEIIAKEFKVYVYGTYLDENSKEFYKKCGYDIVDNKFKKTVFI